MAPTQSLIGSSICVVAALSLGLSEASHVKMNDNAVIAISKRTSNLNEHSASASGAATSSTWIATQKLARGSTARNVAAAQYAITANRGFFSWWPQWGWRSFIGWWASWGKSTETKVDAGGSKRASKLDEIVIVDTSSERGRDMTKVELAGTRSFTQYNVDVETVTGDIESLDEAGYMTVARTRSEDVMLRFIRRALAKEGLEVVDNETLVDVVKFYDGECARQSYRNLIEELHRAEHPYLCHSAWTAKVGKQASTEDAAVAALVALGGHVITGKSSGHDENLAGVAERAALSESGYQAVAAAQSTAEMMFYIERVLASLDLKVSDRSGMQHFAPYYSGQCARQSFERLVWELKRAPTRPQSCGGGWVSSV